MIKCVKTYVHTYVSFQNINNVHLKINKTIQINRQIICFINGLFILQKRMILEKKSNT